MAKTKRVAVIGFGNIGSGVVEFLYERGVTGLELAKVVDTNLTRKRLVALPASFDRSYAPPPPAS